MKPKTKIKLGISHVKVKKDPNANVKEITREEWEKRKVIKNETKNS
jgi:hypothetical protein